MIICRRCNTKNSDEAKYCRCCGRKLKAKHFVVCVLSLFIIVGLFVAFIVNNNGNEGDKEKKQDENVVHVSECVDTVHVNNVEVENQNMETKTLRESFGDNFIEIDFPINGNHILLQNIYEWINEAFGGSYNGDVNDYNSMFDYYKEKQRKTIESNEYLRNKIKKIYENSKIITFLFESEGYYGGVHSVETTKGVTFRKIDGKSFSINYINAFYKLKPFVVSGLKEYFKVGTDSDLLECLQIENPTIEGIPMPSEDPWITDNGVVFIYAPYEIACYAEGSPSFSISVRDVMPCVTSTAKSFFE